MGNGGAERGSAPASGPARASVHAVLNAVFLFVFLTLVVALGSLRVAPKSGRVALPFSDTELPDTCRHVVATGQPCPSCGATRSVIYALHGDVGRARAYHPAGVPIAGMLLAQVAMRVLFLRRRSAVLDVTASAAMVVAFAVLLNRW